MGVSNSTKVSRAAVAVVLFGLLFHVVGLTTPFWLSVGGSGNCGLLYQHCGSVCSRDESDETSASWWMGTMMAEIFGLVFGVCCLVLLLLHLLLKKEKDDVTILQICSMCLGYLAALLIVTGVILFSERSLRNYSCYRLGWSYALTVIGGVLIFVTGLLLTIDIVPTC